ncbi:SusF/SusE family outer membrane protein [Zunongwangia sp. HGR-M22]|uniref:SusF/SusE family outer membrane protein n=1 Tax=Zunongwangia sp. HGR-M22 TaxID=3015168 RepID=UPI0022DE33EF|nr:SusF/SusE family outer membrane protein [Zunongwangia sp. HGR-M22]WBL26853.1 SusF/SusE family outer membrane protein [Zunongwangia sp. HGR-M22]
MRNFKYLLIAFLGIFTTFSCSDDDDFTFVAKEDPNGILFTNSAAEVYTLETNNANNLAERFVWNAVDFGVQTPINYELQGATSSTFDTIAAISDGKSTNAAVTVKNMLELAKDAGLDNDPDTEAPNSGELYFRVRAYAGSNGGGNLVEQYSDTLSVMVMLPENTDALELKRELYLVGDATAAGWSNDNNNTPLFRDAENDDIYYFEGRFAGGADVEGFKLLENLGQWQPQWGISEELVTSSEVLGGDPNAFKVNEDTYYSLIVNVSDGTYSMETLATNDAPSYTSIGIIGDSTPGGWDADTDMTQSEFNPHIWYIKDFVLNDGEFKFRANDAWDVSWGIASAAISGETNLGGENITAAPGTYNIWFNDLDGRYLLIPQVEE